MEQSIQISILDMMEEYIELEKRLEEMGGREAVAILGTIELENLYEEIYELEEEILKQFHLPATYQYRSYLFDLTNWEFTHLSYKKELVLNRLLKESKIFIQLN